MMDTMMSDIRFALRSLAKSKLFTAVAVISLALGIGANVTAFSLVNSLALRPLPFADPATLADLHEFSATKLCADCGVGTSFPGFLDWKNEARSFSQMSAYIERPFAVSGTESAERFGGALVSAGTFSMLGINPVLGRDISADDDRPGAAPVVMLGHSLWENRYASDRRIVGQTIRVNGTPHTVIGVMPPNFRFPEFADLWVPFRPNAASTDRDARDFGVVARLRPGVSIATANAEMHAIAKSLEERYPETQKEWTAEATPFRFTSNAMPTSMYAAMLGAVGFVLLIVCANIAGLLLARGAGRQRELAIRLALGATRARIVRHLLTESVILSLIGGALGLLVATWGVDLAVKGLATQMPYYVVFGLDGVSLAFCLIVSIGAGILFGLLPALRASAPDVHSTLKEGSVTVKRSVARGLLVIGELALAMILLAGAGVTAKSVMRVSMPDQSYDQRRVLTGSLEFLDAKYRDAAQLRTAQQQIIDRLATIPGASGAALDRTDFLAGFGAQDRPIRVEGLASVPAGASPRFFHAVTPAYFSVVNLRVVKGRPLNDGDRTGAERVVLLNERAANLIWPSESPLGRRIKLGPDDSLPWFTVVGVVADEPAGRARRGGNMAYVSMSQMPGDRATILLHSDGDPMRLVSSVRAAVASVDGDLPVLALQTAAEQHRSNYRVYNVIAMTMGALAVFAILLAAIGLYGVIAYNTAQRTREIGVRMALGAEARDVMAMVAGQGSRLVAVGILLGAVGSTVLLKALRAILFGASTIDLPVYAAVALLLGLVALAAVWMPARRAARIDPLDALRAE